MAPPIPVPPTTPTPPPPVVSTGIAATAALRAVRVDAAETSADLRFPRLSSEQRAETGATLSADEMEAAEALVRLFGAEGDLGDEAGVQPDLFGHTLAVDRALCGLGRAAGQLEATAAVGEIVTSAQLTELCDRIFEVAEDPALPAEARASCDSLLASTAELTARREQLLAGRKARSALRRTRQAAEREEATKETERLRAHNQIISETRGR